jgi:hypothetical protein
MEGVPEQDIILREEDGDMDAATKRLRTHTNYAAPLLPTGFPVGGMMAPNQPGQMPFTMPGMPPPPGMFPGYPAPFTPQGNYPFFPPAQQKYVFLRIVSRGSLALMTRFFSMMPPFAMPPPHFWPPQPGMTMPFSPAMPFHPQGPIRISPAPMPAPVTVPGHPNANGNSTAKPIPYGASPPATQYEKDSPVVATPPAKKVDHVLVYHDNTRSVVCCFPDISATHL